ncbi:MAG: hypothetical protein ACREON_13315 [Gemmatimonadaceae bacterium]
MAGKTVSAYANEYTARRVEHVARVQERPVSQIASAALAFYVRLPAEAHAAIRAIEAHGGQEAIERVTRDVARCLLDAEYEVAHRRVAEALQPGKQGDLLRTEEDVMDEAVRLSASVRERPRGRARAGGRGGGTRR